MIIIEILYYPCLIFLTLPLLLTVLLIFLAGVEEFLDYVTDGRFKLDLAKTSAYKVLDRWVENNEMIFITWLGGGSILSLISFTSDNHQAALVGISCCVIAIALFCCIPWILRSAVRAFFGRD